MTNHFSQKLSKQFDEMGLESGSGYQYRISSVNAVLVRKPDEDLYKYFEHLPAYTLSDILQKDSLIKLFGEFSTSSLSEKKQPEYRYHAHQVTDKFMDGGIEAVEEYIINYLNEQNER